VISKPTARLDERDAAEIVKGLLARRPGYVPEWKPGEKGADAAIARIFARYLYAIIQRLNRAPEKNKLAFLDLLGLSLVPASAARAPIVFQLSADAPDSRINAGAQVTAPPPPGSSDQIVFETERGTGLAAAQLKQVVSLWPARDQYLDHTASLVAGESFELFRKPLLEETPHAIYIAHDAVLALAGSVAVEVEFELTQNSDEPLSILWQYWDGKVWRGFKSARAACSEKEFEHADSTAGFTHSGKFSLESDCAESAKREVNGAEAFWIRGQLTEVLPPDPASALPLVESIRLRTIFDQSLKAALTPVLVADQTREAGSRIHGKVTNEAGQLLEAVTVKVTDPKDANFVQKIAQTGSKADAGKYSTTVASTQNGGYEVRVSFLALEGVGRLSGIEEDRDLEVDLTFNVVGLDPDKAFADGTKLDVSTPFFPFGQQPQPGSTFYIKQDEVFGKPGAKVQIYVARTTSPQDKLDVTPLPSDEPIPIARSTDDDKQPLDHLIAWEYWNGRRWVTMFQSSAPQTAAPAGEAPQPVRDLDVTEIIPFEIPPDIEKTKVNDDEGYWIRARLVRGGFGFTQTVSWRDENTGKKNQLTYVVNKPPSLAALRIGYTWQYGPIQPERVLAYNDFRYEDRTYEATWPGNAFPPFNRVADVTPALYLGFDKKFPTDNIGLYFDIVEERGETRGPAMTWEYFDGSGWRALSVEDETRNLRLPGIVSFIAAEESRPLARFGQELHWLRGRLKEDGPPGEPVVSGIFVNAVRASQRQTFTDVPLGASNGLPDQVFRFTQVPVLAGERIEVRELRGARANVEWRILAMEISGQDPRAIPELEEMLGREGAQADIVRGDLRLRRDRNKRVVEAWVRWAEREHLFASGPEDRHYVIDRARGLVFVGDGTRGKVPPPGAEVLSRLHASGGGLTGNVEARAIKQSLTPIPGVQTVFNPRAAEGGADGETAEAFAARGPLSVRHRGRALAPSDYETLAREASPAVARARAIATRNPSGRMLPGWVTLIIVPQSKERRPWPSFGLREQVRRHLEERAPADIAAANQIYVTGPDYLPIDVAATIAPKEAGEAGAVERRARAALEEFLHPLRGGPERQGWDMGRDVYLSDVAAVIERVEGVDYVKELELLKDGQLQGDRVDVSDDRVVVAGDIRLNLEAAE
jgi:uncharacterized phage protein gp47/JayE